MDRGSGIRGSSVIDGRMLRNSREQRVELCKILDGYVYREK